MSKKKKKSKAGLFIAIIITIFAVAYLGVSLYFTKHFLFNTYVNDIFAYKMTAGDIEKAVTDELKKYSLTINSRGDLTDYITSDDISLSLQLDGQFDRALKEQNPFLWPKYYFTETRLTTDNIVVYSRDVLENKVSDLSLFRTENIKEPVDAYLSEESGDDGFYIIPEDYGQNPIKDKVVDRIVSALDILEPEVTIDDECYELPQIYQDNEELTQLRDNLNVYCKAIITYVFGDEKVVVDGTRIREWCDVNGTSVSFDEEKVKEFVKSLARQYDTFGKNRTIISHTGEEVTVTGGDYGWWMDRSTEASELIEAIKRGDQTERTPVYFGTAATYGEKDWGDNYVEIDLTNQHLWVYQNGSVVVDSDFVSGCVNKGRMTPVGTYGITYKERDATLVGENYASAVKYWMPFNGNVGMHDASWRSSFGGWIYIIDGSHGCINLPTEKAAEIFDIVEKGEAIFVYGGKTEPEAVITREVVNPDTGEVTVTRMPASAAAAAGIDITPQPAETPAEAGPADGGETPVAEQPAEQAPAEQTPAETPAEQPAAETPAEPAAETPAEQPSAEEAPVEPAPEP